MSATMCSANEDLSWLARGPVGSRAEKNAAASLQEVCNKGSGEHGPGCTSIQETKSLRLGN
jgi:hypothetical protein